MNNSSNPFDKTMMQRCLEIARQGKGQTAPNPMVGAVILQGEEIVGEGFHPGAGKPHAEVMALRQAEEKAYGATVYVNLEPCNHHGRTPPCTEALIAARVAKVVVGMIDPNPLVSGAGVARLREAGLEVIVGVEEEACRQLNEAFSHRILYRLPLGILKYAMTLDGKIATTMGHSAWVTGDAARHQVHLLRAACDVVIIGGNTVRRDNPHLTTHGVATHNPLRVVMSRSLNLPGDCRLWDTRQAATLVLTETGSNKRLQQDLLAKGVEVIEFEELTPLTAMKCLYDKGMSAVLWECGGVLAAKALQDGVIQKVMAFISPKIIGGENAPSPVGDLGFLKMTEALGLERVRMSQIDSDFMIEGYIAMKS